MLPEVAAALGVARVLGAVRYEPAAREADSAAARALADAGFDVLLFPGFLLHPPEDVRLGFPGKWVGHYGTLTPFVAACRALDADLAPAPAPGSAEAGAFPPGHPAEAAAAAGASPLGELGLDAMPAGERWSAAFDEHWPLGFGEAAAGELLRRWVASGFRRYERDRSRADAQEAVSRLSPYLRLGVLSPRRMLEAIEAAGGFAVSKTAYRRLYWRDLAYWQLHHWPRLSADPIRPAYAGQRWRAGPDAAELLEGWRRGRTGFPLVDAAMRELVASGYITQSARMAAAAYLTDYCNVDWREGARHFHDYLVDGDLAINGMMWQNAAKCGIDQWSFTVSPVCRSQDPKGEYIRQWVPELRGLPREHLHEPWDAPPGVLAEAGVVLGGNYPHRHPALHDLRAARAAALAAAREAAAGGAGGAAAERDANGYDVIDAPRGSTTWKAPEQQRIRVYTIPPLRGERQAGDGDGDGPKAARAEKGKKRPRKGAKPQAETAQRSMTEFLTRAQQPQP